MSTERCQAADPNTCRYHGGTNRALSELREQRDQALRNDDSEKFILYSDELSRYEMALSQAERLKSDDPEAEVQKMIESVLQGGYQSHTRRHLDMKLSLQGGMTESKALYDLEGKRLNASLKYVEDSYSRHGGIRPVWMIREGTDPEGEVKEWFNPSRAENETTARRNNARKGYYVGKVRGPGVVVTVTSGSFVAHSKYYEIAPDWRIPSDDPRYEDLDNGQ